MVKKLDLHGIRHEAARQKVIRIIEDNWDSDSRIEVITGHSTRMKEIVRAIGKEYKLEVEIGQGCYRHRIIIFMRD